MIPGTVDYVSYEECVWYTCSTCIIHQVVEYLVLLYTHSYADLDLVRLLLLIHVFGELYRFSNSNTSVVMYQV